MERLRQALMRSGSITTYVHAKKEDFSLSTLKSVVPDLNVSNWTLLRDYIFYGPVATLEHGPGSLFYQIADYVCSRRTMKFIVVPAISDLRFEQMQALADGQQWKAIEVRIRGGWYLARTLALSFWRNRA
jgi:hypothetical protein